MAPATSSVGFLNMLSSACLLRNPQSPRKSGTRRLRRVHCAQSNGASGSSDEQPSFQLDRREMLLAMGGLCGASGPSALASPVLPPLLNKCKPAAIDPYIPKDSELLKCCPPYTGTELQISDYTFPKTPLRVRRPAHLVIADKEYMEKYHEAIARMKALPEEDPRNFYQQAKIHCAYCNDSYDQVGFKIPLQVHFSWLFLPWHRYYVHFHERILGKLIGDDTFALPYWNYDNPAGMTMPAIFRDDKSPLYNPNRNPKHIKEIIDYRYSTAKGSTTEGNERIRNNLDYLRRVVKESLALPELFMGDPEKAGDEVVPYKGMGQIESIHNAFHQWVGTENPPYLDMGSFATSGRDCCFYTVHTNVDRLWQIYRNLRGGKVEFNNPDWLDATFIFYDEDSQVVKVKVRDSLETSKLCYTYEEQPLPWLGKAPRKKAAAQAKNKQSSNLTQVGDFGSQPKPLDTAIRALVNRPKTNRSRLDKEDEGEVLVVKDIEVGPSPARFDVYVAAPTKDGRAGPDYGDFIGSFVKLVNDKNKGGVKKLQELKLGITGVLEEIDAEDAEKLVVTLVPSYGDVTVGGIQIKLLETDNANYA